MSTSKIIGQTKFLVPERMNMTKDLHCNNKIKEIWKEWGLKENRVQNRTICSLFIRWEFPCIGWLKLNFDISLGELNEQA